MKIFGIGLSRTGTVTLTYALMLLGYDSIHAPTPWFLPELADTINKHDAFTDSQIAIQYKEIDKLYPGSKFILTERSLESWLRSYETFLLKHKTNFISSFYGDGFNKERFTEVFIRHYKEVKEYFKDRPDDLLIMDFSKGTGWRQLCKFLNKPIPKKSFPYLNKNEIKWKKAYDKLDRNNKWENIRTNKKETNIEIERKRRNWAEHLRKHAVKMAKIATGNLEKIYFTIRPLIFLLEGKKDLIIAELGVLFGNSALSILNNYSVKKYYAIDLWEAYDDYIDEIWGIHKCFKKKDKVYNDFIERVKEFPQVEIIREYTHEAHKHIKNGELDFCFIDANHNYNYCYKDIELWLPKVKKGGILCGDDYRMDSVRNAVNDFFRDTKYKLNGLFNSWWVEQIVETVEDEIKNKELFEFMWI